MKNASVQLTETHGLSFPRADRRKRETDRVCAVCWDLWSSKTWWCVAAVDVEKGSVVFFSGSSVSWPISSPVAFPVAAAFCSHELSSPFSLWRSSLHITEALKVSVPLWLCVSVSEPSEAAVLIAYPEPSVLHLPAPALWEPRWINTMMAEFWAAEKTNRTFHNQWWILI